MKGLANRVVAITGGAGGIGSATVRRFAEEGAKIAVLDLNEAAAKQLAAEITASGGAAIGRALDITDYERTTAVIAEIETALGPIDILVNNAGWDVFKPFLKTNPAEWQKLIAINLTGVLNVTHNVLPGMVARRHGRIINISSDAARVGSSGEAVYAACKAGMLGFSKTLAREHAGHGITVNIVCPGPTDTNLFEEFRKGSRDPAKLDEAFKRAVPMGRIGQPGDLPGAICFFASDDAGYITGQVLSVSGGLTMAG